ncbi:MAG: N-acetylmuramoyl-L-alanine amidase [Oscillospiraceae bacterium]|nr:N-acetylmuramoyl-L-alanine amidase [Oscillospiraceae bacterium]
MRMIPVRYIAYTVQPGDTLWLLSHRFGTTVGEIKSLNNLTGDLILIGWRLMIPAPALMQSVIVIDAGHGGTDPGAVYEGRMEKDDNLRMALAIRERLLACGQQVIMTRYTDVFIPLAQRSEISNQNGADIFVSVHRNSSNSPGANGVETYIQNGADALRIRNAQIVHGEIISAGVQSNGGVRQGNYAVLRETYAPAMMLELGYITNERDNELFDQSFSEYADAAARGILISLAELFPPPVPLPYFSYSVQNGDTLWTIAQTFGTTMDAIIALNSLTGPSITYGQILKIPLPPI